MATLPPRPHPDNASTGACRLDGGSSHRATLPAMPKPTEFHEAMARALTGLVPAFQTYDETGSTNDDARALAREGAAHLTTVVADVQTAGRGRRGRSWIARPGDALLASWVIRPTMPVEQWSVLPLIVGVACVEAVRARTGVDAALKWPNDVMVGERKLGGILVEAEPPAFAVAGVGINSAATVFPEDLRTPPTSLAIEGASRLDRADLLAAILRSCADLLGDPEASLARYRGVCATLGRRIRVERAQGNPIEGVARDVDASGALLVDGERVSTGDVVHLSDAG